MTTLYDTEDGEPLCVLRDDEENRRDSRGRRLGPRARDARSYDERQIAPKDADARTDVQGAVIDGP